MNLCRDDRGALEDVLERVRVDRSAERVEFSPSLGVPLSLARAGVGDLSLDLDDQWVRGEVEVDTGDRLVASPVDDLGRRSGQTVLTAELKEPALQTVRPPGIHEDAVDGANPIATSVTDIGQPLGQKRRRRGAGANRRVDGVLQRGRRTGRRKIEDGERGTRAQQAIDRGPVHAGKSGERVDDRTVDDQVPTGTGDRDLDRPGSEAIEAVQRRCRAVTDDGARPAVVEGGS